MEVTYSLFDPTGNITLLVETPVPEEVFGNPTQERTKQFLRNYQQ